MAALKATTIVTVHVVIKQHTISGYFSFGLPFSAVVAHYV